jgi:hypothetical protein
MSSIPVYCWTNVPSVPLHCANADEAFAVVAAASALAAQHACMTDGVYWLQLSLRVVHCSRSGSTGAAGSLCSG